MEIKYGYSKAKYAGNGVQTDFVVPFPFLHRRDVVVSQWNETTGLPQATSFSIVWINDGMVQIAPTPAAGITVWVERDTSQRGQLVDFQSAAVVTEADLDTAYLQAMYIAQEALDEAGLRMVAGIYIDAAVAAAVASKDAAAVSAAAAAASVATIGTEVADASAFATAAGVSAAAAAVSAASAADAAAFQVALKMDKAANLSDLANAVTARGNLGLGTMAVEAAADYLTKAGNLAGIADAAAARTSLGLGTMAVADAVNYLSTAGNLAGLTNLVNARYNIGITNGSDYVATARLGTGVADATTFLRGDNTWQAGTTLGVSAFNTRTGAVTLTETDVVTARPHARDSLVMNGSMVAAQTGNTTLGLGTTLNYACDGWGAQQDAAANGTVSQVAAGSGKALALLRNAGATETGIIRAGQAFESIDCIPYQGQVVTLSFKAACASNYSAAGSAMLVKLRSGTGTNETTSNLMVGAWTGSTYLVDTTAILGFGYATYTYTVTVPAGATQLGFLFGFTPVGTAGALDGVYVRDIKIEVGSVATPLIERYDDVLRRCQRQFQIVNSNANVFVPGYGPTAGGYGPGWYAQLPVEMRVAPTLAHTVGALSNVTSLVTYVDKRAVQLVPVYTAVGAGFFYVGTLHANARL